MVLGAAFRRNPHLDACGQICVRLRLATDSVHQSAHDVQRFIDMNACMHLFIYTAWPCGQFGGLPGVDNLDGLSC